MLTEHAPAKVNLTLHVTGQRDDGYHLLDSLVVFADIGDTLAATPDATGPTLRVSGPEAAAVPTDSANSILKATSGARAYAFHLTKNLPTAAGIGGGTADAAAAIRLVGRGSPRLPSYDPADLTEDQITSLIAHTAPLGADVPVCLFSRAARMRGIGDQLDFLPNLPALHAVLVNPRIAVSTPEIFKALGSKSNAPMPSLPRHFGSTKGFISWLANQRNDLQRPAMSLVPDIGYVLRAIEFGNGCLLSRMSGSGATCFGIYESERFARPAAARLAQLHPDWWVQHCVLN